MTVAGSRISPGAADWILALALPLVDSGTSSLLSKDFPDVFVYILCVSKFDRTWNSNETFFFSFFLLSFFFGR